MPLQIYIIMKKLILIALFISVPLFCVAQSGTQGQPREIKTHTTIDDCLVRVSYKHVYNEDTTMHRPLTDYMRLDIGKNYTKFYSNLYLISDSVKSKLIEKQPYIEGQRQTSSDYYFNYPDKGNLKTTRRVIKVDYAYDTPIENPKWEMLLDTATILGYKCQKAFADYHGRRWEVWFTLEIPYQMGPWKLHGLPGTVLKASTTDKLFDYTAIAIETPKKAHIYHYNERFVKSNRKQMRKYEELMYTDPVGLRLSFGSYIIVNYPEGSKPMAAGSVTLPYQPSLELE